MRRLFFDIQPSFGDARDDRVKFFANSAGEKLHLFHFNRVALGIRGGDLAFGGVKRECVERLHFLRGDWVAASMRLDKPVDEKVRIAANRRSEVRIKVERKTEVADVARRVDGLAH